MQQPIRPVKRPLHAKVTLPGSKSMTHRALLLAALADGVSEISGLRMSSSTQIFIRALHQLGIVTQLDEKARSCIIAGGNGKFPKKQASLWCAHSKSLAIFLLATAAATPGVFYFDGSLPLRQRSFGQLLEILCRQGAQLIPSDAHKLPFTLIGCDALEGGELKLDEVSGLLVSALLMMAPFSRSPSNFIMPDLANQPYVDMTCSMMAEFGVLVHRIHQSQLMVPVPQRYQSRDFVIEPDFSIAVYFLAAAAITGGEVTIQPIKRTQSKQLDIKFLAILETMGCKIQETAAGLTVKGCTDLQGIEISLKEFSDTFLALVSMAPFTKSPIRISHIGPMKKSELNCFMAIKAELVKLNVHIESGPNWIKVFPGLTQGTTVNTHHNPHIAMALAVIGLKTQNMIIENIECMKSFYPDFFSTWDTLSPASINA